jgi:hypothetical protein
VRRIGSDSIDGRKVIAVACGAREAASASKLYAVDGSSAAIFTLLDTGILGPSA